MHPVPPGPQIRSQNCKDDLQIEWMVHLYLGMLKGICGVEQSSSLTIFCATATPPSKSSSSSLATFLEERCCQVIRMIVGFPRNLPLRQNNGLNGTNVHVK